MRKKIQPIRQLTQTECGLCCVAMISQYHGLIKPFKFFRNKLDIGRDGTSIKDVIKILEDVNIKSTAYRLDIDFLESMFEPIIVYMSNKHFVVLEKYNNKKKIFTIIDPALGRLNIAKKEFLKKVGSIGIITEPNVHFKAEVEKDNVWRPFWNILKEGKMKFFSVLILSIITYLFTLAIPLLIQIFIDNISIGYMSVFKKYDLFIGVGAIILFLLISFFRNKLLVSLQIFIDRRLMYTLLEHLLKLPYKFFEVRTPGEILFRLNLLNNIRLLLSEGLIRGIIDLGSIVFVLTYMFIISPPMISIVFMIMLSLFIIANIINNYIIKVNQSELIELSSISALESEVVNSIFDIKCLGLEMDFFNKLKKNYEKFIDRFRVREFASKSNISILQFFQLFIPFLLLITNIVIMKDTKLSLGKVVAYYTLSNMVISNSVALFQEFSNFKLMKNTLSRINDILDEECYKKAVSGIKLNTFESLVIEDLGFSYSNNGVQILKGINMNVQKGEKISIVGISGSGKSTLSKLILDLYKATEGRIYFNGMDISTLDNDCLKKIVGIIPQDARLFNGSIINNITLNSEDITKDDAIEAMKQARIYDEIQCMPMREETIVSEFGRNLSGGQRQRIVLARTLVHKPKLLIMDEATSSLDGLNEQEISNILNGYECTQIIISHRLSTIMNSDYIYVMDNGTIVEEGKLDELVYKKGSFHTIFSKQIGNINYFQDNSFSGYK